MQLPAASSRRHAYVDVLRGVAILTVMVHHMPDSMSAAFGRVAVYGGRGVDLFFVLSGFLIGSTVLARAASGAPPGKQGRAYWLLRTVRIWPLYFLLLAIYALGLPFVQRDVIFVIRHYPFHYLTFTSNDLGQATLELGIFWSLAIEEQFYLAVGLLVVSCARSREILAGAFVGMALTAIAVSLRTRYEISWLREHGNLEEGAYVFKLYFSTLSRIDQLAIGILCAVVAPWLNERPWARSPRWARSISWLSTGALVLAMVTLRSSPVLEFFITGLVFAVGVMIAQRPAARGMKSHSFERLPLRFMTGAGKLSFGLYLLHAPVRFWTQRLFDRFGLAALPHHSSMFLAAWLAGTWALAALSYRFLESPLLDRARRRADEIVGMAAQEPPRVRPRAA